MTVNKYLERKQGFLPGMDVEVVTEGNKAFIVKSRHENRFMFP